MLKRSLEIVFLPESVYVEEKKIVYHTGKHIEFCHEVQLVLLQ